MVTDITFMNGTSFNIDVLWLNFQGAETLYATLGPYESYTQSTYAGHQWIVRDRLSGIKIAETNAQVQAVEFEISGQVNTQSTGPAVSVQFRNESPLAVGIYWVSSTGEEISYASLRPGESYTQSTFAEHVWRIRSLHCGTEIGMYIPDATAEQSHEITLRSGKGRRSLSATFINISPLTMELLWLDHAGEATVYHRLAPGERIVQPTYSSHPWILRDAVSGTIVRVVPNFFHDGEVDNDGSALVPMSGTKASRAVLRNLCTETGDVMAIGFDGSETKFATLAPGAEVTIDTFATHPWRLRSSASGEELGLVLIGPKPEQYCEFTPYAEAGRAVSTFEISNKALMTVQVVTTQESDQAYVLRQVCHGETTQVVLREGTTVALKDAASELLVQRVTATNENQHIDLGPLDIRSVSGTESVAVEMRNDTPFDLDIVWVDFAGEEQNYHRLSPGQSYVQDTGRHHIWRARERHSRNLMGIYVASPETTQIASFKMRSLTSDVSTGIRFENDTRLIADVYWMNFDGQEVHYSTLQPGASVGFKTFRTHPWIVRDRQSKRVLDWSWGDRDDALIVLDDKDIKPREGEVPVTLSFKNHLPWTVDVFWLGYGGQEKRYATLGPSDSTEISTFETHPWRIRQTHSGEEISLYIAGAERRQHYDIALKSISSSVKTDINFVNYSPLTLDIFWFDYNGEEKYYATVEPRSEYTQQTFMTHPWVARDKVSGEPVGFTVGLRQSQQVILTGAATRSRDIGSQVRLRMVNESGLKTDIYWINHEGEEVSYGTVDPGGVFDINTYPTHSWRMREYQGGAEIDLYIANTEAQQTHAIRNMLVRTKERANAVLWPGEVAFYEHEQFDGRVWIVHEDTPDCVKIASMNDTISSVRVGPDTAATIFQHTRYEGEHDVIYMDTPSLADSDVGDNAISSMSILSIPPLEASRIGSTSRLTEEVDMVNGRPMQRPALRSIISLPPMTGTADIWATEELQIKVNGRDYVIDPVKPARVRVNDTGKL